jgi:hypothetical protein
VAYELLVDGYLLLWVERRSKRAEELAGTVFHDEPRTWQYLTRLVPSEDGRDG